MGLFGINNKNCNKENDHYNNRNHQDNFYGDTYGGWDNDSYQYCRFCGAHRTFENDRCSKCKNN